MTHYVLFPEARSRLEQSGLQARLSGAEKHPGFLDTEDVRNILGRMISDGFFEHCPQYAEQLSRSVVNPVHWRIYDCEEPVRQQSLFDQEVTEPTRLQASVEDMLLMVGWYAEGVLKPEELADPSAFGFRSVSELVGTVGAEIVGDSLQYWDIPYSWINNGKRTVIRGVTGDMHGDLRIIEKDVTVYKMMDPMGNEVCYRPEREGDTNMIAAYHSTEPALLVAALKWARDAELDVPLLRGGAKEFLSEVEAAGGVGGNFAEALFSQGNDPENHFLGWDYPLSMYSEDPKVRSGDFIPTNWGVTYEIFMGENKDLVFGVVENGPRREAMRFRPQEAELFIRSLFAQAAHGKGRTRVEALHSTLMFRYSGLEEFLESMKRYSGK
ncbi:TPA: hypothetical protein HA265_04495 [Candidatus Woesearchaeota archaeon]|nr:hypothetical protein [Candidatus Woesearchaeota archaeon]